MKKGWQTKSLGDLCDVIGGGTPPKDKPAFYSGEIPWATVRDMRKDVITETEFQITKAAVKSSATNIIPSGNVVIATRVGLGKVCLTGQDTAINQDLRGIVPRSDKALVVRYLYWWLKSIADVIVAEGTGATVQGVKLPFVKSLQIPVPPLAEQQRIVGLLDEAFEGLATAKANAEKNLQNARAIFESHLQSVFTQRGPGWVETTLEDICVKITDGEHLRPKVTPSGVPFLSAKDVLAHDVVFSDHLFVSEENAAKFRKRCNPEMGDILIVSRGATVGRTCVVKTDRIFCLLGSVILLKIHASQSSRFISYALKSPAIRDQLMTASEAAAQQAIYLRDIKPLEIGCPPVAVQQSIAEKLDALSAETQRLARIYERKLAALAELKKSLLHQAFTGEL